MRVFLIFCFLFFKFVCYSQSTQKSLVKRKYSPEQLRQDATLLKDVFYKMHPVLGIYQTKENFINDWDGYINKLADSLTEKEFRIQLKLLADKLNCGHTEVMSSKAYSKEMKKVSLGYSPYVFIPIKNKVYLLSTLNKKKDTLMKVGDEIVSINNFSVDTLINQCSKMITGDGFIRTGKEHYLQVAFNAFYPSLFGRPDTFLVKLKTNSGEKTVKYKTFKIKTFPNLPLNPKEDSTLIKYKRANMKHKFLDENKKTMYLKIDGFSHKKFKKAYKKIFRKMYNNNSENLILDLRNNGGGSLTNSYRLIRYLIDTNCSQSLITHVKSYPEKKYTSGNFWFKSMKFIFKKIGNKRTEGNNEIFSYTLKPNKKYHYSKKIYVLINGGSFSASCLTAAYLKYKNRATFIGIETAGALEGCNAGITPYYTLPHTKLKVRVPAFRIQHDVFNLKTGRGIFPDYEVNYTFDDIIKRRDLELEKVKTLILGSKE